MTLVSSQLRAQEAVPKTWKFVDQYKIPKKGFLFRSRAKATAASLHYKAISAHIRRQAPMFLEFPKKNGQKWRVDLAKIRAHSGRATFIKELMGSGLTGEV